MEATHAGCADELANRANTMRTQALGATEDAAETGWSNYPGTGRESAKRVVRERLGAVQAQAQLHATLALTAPRA